MKTALTLFLCIFFAAGINVAEVREMYPQAVNSEGVVKKMVSKLAAVTNQDDKTLLAYKGASLTLVSKFEKRKLAEKTKMFKDGAKLVELAVASEPENIEIRLVRLSIQESVPAIVNYRKNIQEDKTFLLSHYKQQQRPLKEYVINFILQSKSFTATEKHNINS